MLCCLLLDNLNLLSCCHTYLLDSNLLLLHEILQHLLINEIEWSYVVVELPLVFLLDVEFLGFEHVGQVFESLTIVYFHLIYL